MHDNPYAPPRTDAPVDPHAGMDSADLFIESLPPPVLKAAGLSWLASGAIASLLLVRLLLNVEQNAFAGLLEAGQLILALGSFAVGVGLLRGYPALAVVGFVLAPFTFGSSVFALLTGSIAGLAGISVSGLAVLLTLVSWKALGKVSAARVALARMRGAHPGV
jgi:hypothetical protein